MNKDEKLQLCIQRFVADSEAMINNFSEHFHSEVRRFADVLMEFSLAFRALQEDRNFLTAENRSLKDELAARHAELDMLAKEMRETREENEELVRHLEAYNSSSMHNSQQGSMQRLHLDRHYAVVNSMPSFPRRYSAAASATDGSTSSNNYIGAGGNKHHRHQQQVVSIDLNNLSPIPSSDYDRAQQQQSCPNSRSSSSASHLLTPPMAFKVHHNTTSTHDHPETIIERKSLSRDDISLYASPRTPDNDKRAPSFDGLVEHRVSPHREKRPNEPQSSDPTLLPSLMAGISSSAGTFYDCVDTSISDILGHDGGEAGHNLENATEQIKLMCERLKQGADIADVFAAAAHKLGKRDSGPLPQVFVSEDRLDEEEELSDKDIRPEDDMFEQQQREQHSPRLVNGHSKRTSLTKTPSPTTFSFDDHFNAYLSPNCSQQSGHFSGPMLEQPEDLGDDREAGGAGEADDSDYPVDPYCHLYIPRNNSASKNRKRKRLSRKANKSMDQPNTAPIDYQGSNEQMTLSNTKWYNQHDHHEVGSATKGFALQMLPSPSRGSFSLDSAYNTQHLAIPAANIELTRYLLVEVCHFLSPSHFYLLVNDEKIGSNAIEDFLDSFQEFYCGLEEFAASYEEFDEAEWRVHFSMPPETNLVTVATFWACYIDDEYDWRRVVVTGFGECDSTSSEAKAKAQQHSLVVMVRDVDSGLTVSVPHTSLRPLAEEWLNVPAFAFRASLAHIYPRARAKSIDSTTGSMASTAITEWSREAYELFEELTYEQILTASVIQLNAEELTDTEVAQVLLWTTGDDDHEVLINRRLIELGLASNVCEDDHWLNQFAESGGNNLGERNVSSGSIGSSSAAKVTNHITKFVSSDTIKIEQPKLVVATSASPSPEVIETFVVPLTQITSFQRKTSQSPVAETVEEIFLEDDETEKAAVTEANDQQALEDTTTTTTTVVQEEQLPKPTSTTKKRNAQPIDPNMLLVESTGNSGLNKICPSYLEAKEGRTLCASMATCSLIHHDPKLSDWILQQHSRAVLLKKSPITEKFGYLFRVTSFVDSNKIIGILPFGEQKLSLDTARKFVEALKTIKADGEPETCQFKKFVLEMSDFYRKQISKAKMESIKLDALEQCLSNTQPSTSTTNHQLVSFYHRRDALYYRGHVVGQEPPRPSTSMEAQSPTQSKSPELSSPSPTADGDEGSVPRKRKSIKLKSRPKSEVDTMLPKWIVYSIDTGRYHLIPIERLYPLEDKFQTPKPFAISCRLHDYTPPIKSAEAHKAKLCSLLEGLLVGLRFVDIDQVSDRHSVALYSLEQLSTPITSTFGSPVAKLQNILTLI